MQDGGPDAERIARQIEKARLPMSGSMPFVPRLVTNRQGREIIEKAEIQGGPRKGKRGYVDEQGRIWIRDRAHGSYPDHWDVQENGGSSGHFRVGDDGELLP